MNKKLLILFLAFISCIASFVGVTACSKKPTAGDNQDIVQPKPDNKPSTIAVTGVTLNKALLSLEVGDNETLTATVAPDNATNKAVTWKSSDNSVAKVENGKVTAIKAGTATITATAGSKSATCEVTVTNVKVLITEIILDFTELTIKSEETFTLTTTILPTNATDRELEWISSNTKVATVSNDGTITALASGTAVIIVSSSNGVQSRCNVTVKVNTHGLVLGYYNGRPNELWVTGYTGEEEKIEIPSAIEDKTIVGISSFSGNKSVKEVVIPDTVTTIYGGAFKGCENLVSVYIPESVTSLGDPYNGVFSGCKNLQNLTAPFVGNQSKTPQDNYQYPFGIIFGKDYYDGAEQISQAYISNRATNSISTETYCIPKSLKHVTVLSGNILYGAFYNCKMIESITLKDEVISIGDYAFYGCSSLANAIIGDSVTSIGIWAFSGCRELTSVTLGDGVTSIGSSAFSGCKKLVNVNLGKQLASIGHEAFSECYSLTKIYLPNNIALGYFVFRYCKDLTVSYGTISGWYNYWDVIDFDEASFRGESVLSVKNATYVKKEKR